MDESSLSTISFAELCARYPPRGGDGVRAFLARELRLSRRKIIVLDDDPTGVQTVHGVSVYTRWDPPSIEAGFDEEGPLFFILTNSRALIPDQSAALHRELGASIARIAGKKNRDFIIISRSDSTLRGHYPLETAALNQAVAAETGRAFDGEILCPFFMEGGRYTAGNVHYVRTGDALVPAAQTEFARDLSFGYGRSDLTRWVEEKTGGEYPASGVSAITLETLRGKGAVEQIAGTLLEVQDFGKVVLNALEYDDLRIFCSAFLRVLDQGKRFLIRSAAAVPKILGGIDDRPLLGREELTDPENLRGGLIIVGSHVQKTTRQLERLLEKQNLAALEFDTRLVTSEAAFRGEICRIEESCNRALDAGKTTVIYTRRERFDLNTGSPEDELRVSLKIAGAMTGFVAALRGRPRFILAKGGITSSEIGTVALGVKKARVLGQALPGVPVWLTGEESRFPRLPYIIFPGNVGDEDSLLRLVEMLA
jgi:uncharacterized protein YgbK (DUF1537 family)